jgi:hypothetical protein
MSLLTLGPAAADPADQTVPAAKPDKSYTGTVVAIDLQDQVLNVRGWLFGK